MQRRVGDPILADVASWPRSAATDPQALRVRHRQAALERIQFRGRQDLLKKPEHRADSIRVRAEEQNSRMTSGRVSAKIRKTLVRCDEKPPLFKGGDPSSRPFPAPSLS
jgi:hypothetical protein